MKNLTIGIITATTVFLLSAMVALADGPVNQYTIPLGSFGPGNTAPQAFMIWRGFDIGINVDGSGSSINPADTRSSFYAFTGEKIYYYVLVRDANGAADINQVSWTTNAGYQQEGPCADVTSTVTTTPGEDYGCFQAGTSNLDPKVCIKNSNLQFDDQTDKVFQCQLTVESTWAGTNTIQVQAKDQAGATGSTLPESWNFNPPLSVSLTLSSGTSLTFDDKILDQAVPGVTSPNCIMGQTLTGESLTSRTCSKYIESTMQAGQKLCDISFSTNKIVLTNTGIVDLWPFIAASNFYAGPMAKCPFTNELSANQFEYRSTQGTWDSGWRVMPQYSPNLGCSNPATGSCRGGCRITTSDILDTLGPTHSIETQLKIVWPTPCIGTFDTGSIYAIVRAV